MLRPHVVPAGVPLSGTTRDRGGGLHAWKRADAIDELAPEQLPAIDRQLEPAIVQAGDYDAVRPEARIDGHHVAEAAREEQRSEQQRQRQRHLGDDQPTPERDRLTA